MIEFRSQTSELISKSMWLWFSVEQNFLTRPSNSPSTVSANIRSTHSFFAVCFRACHCRGQLLRSNFAAARRRKRKAEVAETFGTPKQDKRHRRSDLSDSDDEQPLAAVDPRFDPVRWQSSRVATTDEKSQLASRQMTFVARGRRLRAA